MEIYSTEEQQVEAIKKFWKEYGISIIGGAVLGLGGLFGWKFYQQHLVDQQEAASAEFDQLVQQANGDADELTQLVDRFKAEHGSSGYSPLAQLILARSAAEAGDFAKAESLLTEVVGKFDKATKPLVQLRLARVQMAQKKLDEAKATLDGITSETFVALREEVKGDLLVKLGDIDGAKVAYEAALQAGGGESNPVLQMKLDDLA